MFLDKIFKKFSKPLKSEQFFVFIESPLKVVSLEILFWGRAMWWPAQANIEVIDYPSADLQVGSRSVIKIKAVLPAKLDTEITKIVPGHLIERTFIKGLLKGTETISIEERYNGMRLNVTLLVRPAGLIQRFFWEAFYHKKYTQAMKLILDSLRDYCQNIQRL